MFPQQGNGFIWDKSNGNSNHTEASIFVPDSKRLFNVAILATEIAKDCVSPTRWIEWNGVGERDASRPIPLMGASLMDDRVDRPIRPEYLTETTFKSVLLFPDRQDLVEFVGENNAWSPFVGIVKCEPTDVNRGVYATAYIVRDYNETVSAFKVNVDKLKFPEGYGSERDKKIFEGLTRQIELAMEEARILASKGKTAGDYEVMPVQKKPYHEDIGDFDQYGDSTNVIRTRDVNRPGWSRGKSKAEIDQINNTAQFLKQNRVHDILVYKKCDKGRGFVGYSPVIGTVTITADSHKITGEPVTIGMNLYTRVEFDKHKLKFEVESVADIKTHPLVEFTTKTIQGRAHLIITCPNLDLSAVQFMDERWRNKRVGVINHPTLFKVLVFEDDVMKEECRGKTVTATLLHHENLENSTPDRIRLVLDKIIRPFDDGSSEPMKVGIPNGCPDDIDDDDDDDEDDEVEEGKVNNEQDLFTPVTGFAPIDNYGYGSGFESNERGRERDGDSRQERGRGRGQHNGMSPRGPPSSSAPLLQHKFSPDQQHAPILDRGILVCASIKSSIFYTKRRELVEYRGDARQFDLRLGDSADFETEPTNDKLIPLTIVSSTIRRISHFMNFKIIDSVKEQDLRIVAATYFAPNDRDILECRDLPNIYLNSSQTSLKLLSGSFIDKSRVIIGHQYYAHFIFDSGDLKWKFACLDDGSKSFVVEPEHEIDRIKRENKEKEKKNSSSEIYDRERSDQHSMKSGWTNSSRSNDNYDRERDRPVSRDGNMSAPSRSSYAPSIASDTTHTTIASMDQELKELRRKHSTTQKMLQNVWGYKSVQKIIKQDNFFLYETIDDLMRTIAEDESETQQ